MDDDYEAANLESEKKYERNIVETMGEETVIQAKKMYIRASNKIKSLEKRKSADINQLSSQINSAIKGKFAKKVEQEGRHETDQLNQI